ncbi:MAG: hypothetical protein KJ558_04415 [Gammaproteobacteria bacterium]|nr:hypothetical protein [Gammaproteobacteria bacterium]MBU1654064.1 hypothetical protein [Gammaproteobacteria bacterium]MBU1962305.1 hypothetical protein [Gammaproteobacteria bacterium]
MDRCPTCRARLDEAASCRRCGMELTLLRQTEQTADRYLAQAVAQLAGGNSRTAGESLRQSLLLKSDPLTERLLGLATAWEQTKGRPIPYVGEETLF